MAVAVKIFKCHEGTKEFFGDFVILLGPSGN